MICILIPVLNEVNNVSGLVSGLLKNLQGEDFNIIFIDDGSTDGTRQYLQKLNENDKRIQLISRTKENSGCERGKALYDGLKESLKNKDYTMFVEMDGDLSHSPDEINIGLQFIKEGSDVVIGSKYLRGGKIMNRSLVRNIISYFNSAIFRLFLSPVITDYSNGFRFYNRKAAEILFHYSIRNYGPIYLGEVLSIWLKNKLKISEFASVYSGRTDGNSKVIIMDVFRSYSASLKIVFKFWFT